MSNKQRIAELKDLLASGAASNSTDGHSTTFRSRSDLLAEIQRLEDEDARATGSTPKRPRAVRINLF